MRSPCAVLALQWPSHLDRGRQLERDFIPLAKVRRLRLDGGNLPRIPPCLTISASMSFLEPRKQP